MLGDPRQACHHQARPGVTGTQTSASGRCFSGIRLGHRGAAMPRWQAVDFRRRRPSSQTLDWVERVARAPVVAWRRMTGGIGSVVHRLTIDHGSYRDVLVLRQYEYTDSDMAALYRQQSGWLPSTSVRHEAAILRAVHDAGLLAPEPVAADPSGRPHSASCGSRHLSPLPASFTATFSPSICSGGAAG